MHPDAILRAGGSAFLRSVVLGSLRDALPDARFEEEYRWRMDRKWRWDLAILPYQVAVEYQGGVWEGGRHVRGVGYTQDIEKMLWGIADGWTVIWLTYDLVRDQLATVIDKIIEAVGRRM